MCRFQVCRFVLWFWSPGNRACLFPYAARAKVENTTESSAARHAMLVPQARLFLVRCESLSSVRSSPHSWSERHGQQASRDDDSKGVAQAKQFCRKADNWWADQEAQVTQGAHRSERDARRLSGHISRGAEDNRYQRRKPGADQRKTPCSRPSGRSWDAPRSLQVILLFG